MSNIEQLPVKHDLMAGGSVKAIIPQSFEDAYRIAKLVVAAGMAPHGMDTAEKVTIAIMHGLEVGLTPLQALQRIAVINGRPTIWGDAAIGLVRASGKAQYVKEWIEGDGDKMVAHCETCRKGETQTIYGVFSVEDAKTAKLWGKAGPWQQFPKRMLQMRARAFALRDGYADVLGGMYLREELEDVPMRDVTPAASPPPPPVVTAPSKIIQQLRESVHIEETIEPELESMADPDAYLDDFESKLAGAKSNDDLDEIWNEHIAVADTLFPPDQDKAQSSFERHEKRLAK
jgi:hypothetical protein